MSDLDPLTGEVIRHQRDRPGELHVDVRKFAQIPDGGGHRKLGRGTATRGLQNRAANTGRAPMLSLHTVLARSVKQLFTDRGVRHVRIKPYCPRTNGKVERFHATLAREWAYVSAYPNTARPHPPLDGRPPLQALATVNSFPGHCT